jgi:DNA polymerase-1
MRIWEQFNEKCGPGGVYNKAYELEMATRKIVTRMEINGARVDLGYSKKKYEELVNYTESVKDWAKKTYNGTSITSNIQLVRLFESLGAEITELTPTGQKSATKDQLKLLTINGNEEVKNLAETVLKQRKADKLASSYFSNFIEKNVNGFVHPSVKTMGARTGRMSITDPALQTLPKGDDVVRSAFLPKDDDHLIVTSDLDQVEFRMFASLSQDPNLIQLFHRADATGSDPFTEIGREVYQEPEMTRSDKRRNLIKGVVYGRLYGAGVAKQALTAGVPEHQMRAVSDSFDRNYPGMILFQKQIEDIGMRRLRSEGQGYVCTWTGRRIPCDDDRTYTLVNYLIQGGAAEVFKSNLIKLDQADLTELLIVPVHDEIVLNAPRDQIQEVMQTVKECMTTTEGWAVPLTSGIDGPMETWGEKYE